MTHATYYPCPYKGCNWWAAVWTVLEGRALLADHCREVHAEKHDSRNGGTDG